MNNYGKDLLLDASGDLIVEGSDFAQVSAGRLVAQDVREHFLTRRGSLFWDDAIGESGRDLLKAEGVSPSFVADKLRAAALADPRVNYDSINVFILPDNSYRLTFQLAATQDNVELFFTKEEAV